MIVHNRMIGFAQAELGLFLVIVLIVLVIVVIVPNMSWKFPIENTIYSNLVFILIREAPIRSLKE